MRASALDRTRRDHYLHPFTDHKVLGEKRSRIITKADGVYIFDSDGNKLLDGMSGVWCVNAGYGRDELVEAAAGQLRELAYGANINSAAGMYFCRRPQYLFERRWQYERPVLLVYRRSAKIHARCIVDVRAIRQFLLPSESKT